MTKLRVAVTLAIAVCAVVMLCGCAGVEVNRLYEHGVVVTGAPIASQVGKSVLLDGGNAFDAAVAVGFALAVVHPEAGNIGGGGFALVRHGATGDVSALDFRETAPGGATVDMYLDDSGDVIPNLSTCGARAAGVPGTVAGLRELWQKYGSMSWRTLVGIAARMADTGFVVDEYLAVSLAEYREPLTSFSETATLYYPGGETPAAGALLKQPDLAATLERIARDGFDGFYRGPVAEKIDSCMREHGGLISLADLESYKPVWREPIHFRFDSLDVYSMPPPSSGGVCLAQILKLLEPYEFTGYTPMSIDYIHLFCEVARLAYADRSEHLGDPDFVAVPHGLIDDSYLARRRELVDEKEASPSQQVLPGSPPGVESEETTHYSICDSDGNMVAVTYTLNAPYGCKLAVEGAGFLLNNEMDDFSVKPGVPNLYGLIGGEANKIEPGKRMLSSMSPTLVLRNGRPYLALGSPGGSKIITTVAEAIIDLTRFGLSPAQTVAQPRFHHQWLPDVVYLEEGQFDINIIQGLIGRSHDVREREAYGDLQIIAIDEEGMMVGASDPRRRGSVEGL